MPVFLLHELDPTLLATLSNPATYGFPLDLLVGGQTAQEWLHRWDGVDLTCPNPPLGLTGAARDFSPECLPSTLAFSAQWSCAIFVELVPTVIFAYTLAALLLFSPVQSLLGAALYLLLWIVAAAGFLIFAFIMGWVAVWIALPVKFLQGVAVDE